MKRAARLDGIEISLIRQINALATSQTVNLGIGEPNLEPDEILRGFARRAAETPWRYSPIAGHLSLRKKVAESFAPGYDPGEEICVTAGTQEALYAIFQAYVNPGDEVLVPNPGFSAYHTIARICGAAAITYDLEAPSWRLDADALRFTPKTRLVVVNSPSNPLGTVIDSDTLQRVAERADEHGALVVSDEVYGEIWYDTPTVSMAGMRDNVAVIGGMSKSHGMTGLRIGWVLARRAIMGPIVTAHQYIATCASVFSQALAEMVLDARAWNDEWLARVRAQFRDQREAALYAVGHELGIAVTPPAGAFYLFMPSPACNTLDFAKTLATDAAVLVIPGMAFGSAGEGFVRVSFAAPVEQIAAGIERIARFVGNTER